MGIFRRKKLKIGLATSRVEAFSDGVFAIAITLLILGLIEEVFSIEHGENIDVWQLLKNLFPGIVSYVISFSIIGIFWVGHHIMFHYIVRIDRQFLWLNNIFLMIIAFFPFPAALIGKLSLNQGAIVLYGLTLALAGLFFLFGWLHASTGHHLIDHRFGKDMIKLATKVVLLAPAVYMIAVLLAFVNPLISVIIYILVPVFYLLPGPIDTLADYDLGE